MCPPKKKKKTEINVFYCENSSGKSEIRYKLLQNNPGERGVRNKVSIGRDKIRLT